MSETPDNDPFYQWLREPDYADNFGLNEFIEWANKRPIGAYIARDAEIARLRGVLARAQTVLGNMAEENEGAYFKRWPINHEPLRADARALLPEISAALDAPQSIGVK